MPLLVEINTFFLILKRQIKPTYDRDSSFYANLYNIVLFLDNLTWIIFRCIMQPICQYNSVLLFLFIQRELEGKFLATGLIILALNSHLTYQNLCWTRDKFF